MKGKQLVFIAIIECAGGFTRWYSEETVRSNHPESSTDMWHVAHPQTTKIY